jgi:hypothetical protein
LGRFREYDTSAGRKPYLLAAQAGQHSRGSSKREENRTLVFHLRMGIWISGCMEMVEAENLYFVTNV